MRLLPPLFVFSCTFLLAVSVHAIKNGSGTSVDDGKTETETEEDSLRTSNIVPDPVAANAGCGAGEMTGADGVCTAVNPQSNPIGENDFRGEPESVLSAARKVGNNVVHSVNSGAEIVSNARRKPKPEDQPLATVTFEPAKTPEARQDRQEVARLIKEDNPAAAREYALAALERTPDDPALLSFVKLSAPVKTAVDQKTVRSRIAELAAGMRQDEGTGEGGAILASPISFGALTGGAARAPGALPGGLAAPDLRGAAALRDASGKIGLKDYAGAESSLTRRIEEAPTDAGAFRLRALTRRYLKRYEDSSEDAKRALALNSGDSRSLHLLSRNLTDLGRPKEALIEADRALALDNKDANAYVARSAALGALGRAEEALADLSRAATLDSQFDSLYQDTLAVQGRGAKPSRYWPVWLGAVGTALLFFSFALFRKRGDSSIRMALRQDDHDLLKAAAPRVDAVPKGFRVVKTLGQGGMGVVYEAVDLGLQRTVALKKLRPEVADNARERGRFLKEARTVAALKHPNIVEIHAVHEDAEGLFIVFERVPGETLHELLGRGPVPPAEAAALLKQIAAALDYAHGQGVVHQDLKPANVMIHAGQAKVMDFGIARRVQETLSTMSKIEVAGTPAYMSPEQEQGVVTPSADVFALGACAYETLTGALPFPTGGMMLKAQKMYRKPSEASPGLKPGVDAVIARALEPRPEDRWPSASSFVDALSRALS